MKKHINELHQELLLHKKLLTASFCNDITNIKELLTSPKTINVINIHKKNDEVFKLLYSLKHMPIIEYLTNPM